MSIDLTKVREQLEQQRDKRGRVPAEVRREVVRVLEQARKGGRPYRELAAEIGMSLQTLMGWRHQERHAGSKLAPVKVAAVAKPASSLVVHGPRGLRVEGLSVAELSELWVRLS